MWQFKLLPFHFNQKHSGVSIIYLLAGPPGAAQDNFTISLWKSPVQIDLSDQGKKIRWAVGWVLSGAELPAYHWGQVKWEVPNKFQEKCSKANTPIWWGGPCGLGVGVSPPQIEFYQVNLPRGATFVCWPTLNSIPSFGGVDPAGQGLRWAPHK